MSQLWLKYKDDDDDDDDDGDLQLIWLSNRVNSNAMCAVASEQHVQF